MSKIQPTEKQIKYAHDISRALDDDVDLDSMDKWQIRDYISNALSHPETKKKISDYTYRAMRREHEKIVAERMSNPSYKWKKEWEEQNKCSSIRSEREDETTISRYFTNINGRWERKKLFPLKAMMKIFSATEM